jgi:alpha/beta superfamily hydrolase
MGTFVALTFTINGIPLLNHPGVLFQPVVRDRILEACFNNLRELGCAGWIFELRTVLGALWLRS